MTGQVQYLNSDFGQVPDPSAPATRSNDTDLHRRLVNAITGEAVYAIDLHGIIGSWNPGAVELAGYQPEEIIGRHHSRLFTPEDRARARPAAWLEEASRTGRHETEGWRLHKDGSRYRASTVVYRMRGAAAEQAGFAIVSRHVPTGGDMAALGESERQFRLLVGGVTDYALFMLDPDGVVVSWNAGAQRTKGYSADEIIGRHFSVFYTERDRAAGLPAKALRTAAEQGRFEAEAWRVRKDGGLFLANVVIDPIRDADGQLLGFSKITRDVTERVEAQRALQETQAQLAQMQKMEALGQLTGGVAHDFNNLMMVVSGYLPTIKRLAADDARGTKAVAAIEMAARRGATLTRQLLTFSRRQSLSPRAVDILACFEKLEPILASVLGGAVRLATSVPVETWPVRVDAGELELAILNLVVNARDAMPSGGAVELTARNARLGDDQTPGGLAGDFVGVTVSDTGQGIPPDILGRVFEPFFTTKGVGKGTGLGLSQVHGFAHQSGGAVAIESEIGQGTRVVIYLPRMQEKADPEDLPPTGEERPALGKVLLVEDNPDVAEATREMLVQFECDIEVAGDPAAALAAIERTRFDLVLSDIVMTGPMNGLDLARAIRKQRPQLRVVLVTGYSDAAAQAATEFPVLRKPYGLPELTRAMNQPR